MRKLLTVIVLCALIPHTACAEGENEGEFLLGDVGGVRPWFASNGGTLEMSLTQDLFLIQSGESSGYEGGLGNIDVLITLDTADAGLWKNGTFFFYGLANYGKQPSERSGEIQVANNIETISTAKLYEFWYEHTFADRSWSLLAGLHDFNSEFYVLDSAANLINSSFGIGVDVAQVGPSIFATTALAARVRYQPSDQHYLIAAVYDGVPGSPRDPRGTQISLSSDDGAFYAIEGVHLGAPNTRFNKLALGAWYHTTDYEDPTLQERDHKYGFYALVDYRSTEALSSFLQLGTTQPSRNLVRHYIGAGFRLNAPSQARPNDALSVGLAHARIDDHYRDLTPNTESAETVLEINYRIQVTPYLALTPDVQYIINPGASRDMEDTLISTIRAELAL